MAYRLFKKNRAYLDWASAAPVHPRAARAFERALAASGNPSSPHAEGRAAKGVLEQARTRIARLAGVKPHAVVFTSGATEANNLAMQGRAAALCAAGIAPASIHILYLPTMHASVLKTLAALAREGVQTEPITLKDGAVDLEVFASLLRPETALVCVDAVCGETGIRYDTLRLRRAIDAAGQARTTALHVDASQLPLAEPIERTRLGADLLTLDAQKVGGVRGIGALIVPDARLIAPVLHGGGQEAGLRPGTEPVALAAAFAEALTVRAEGAAAFTEAARATRALLIGEIARRIPQAVVNEAKSQVPHILNLSLPGFDTDYAVTLLDTDGYAVATKSACETDSAEGSKAVLALTQEQARAEATLRISWGPETPQRDLRRFPEALERVTTFLAA